MDTKKLKILAGILVVGCLLVLVTRWLERGERSLVEETGYTDLAPEWFLKADVAWFEIWRGGKEDKKVVLNRKEEKWTVGSRFDAPADEEKVDKFLGMYKGLMGTVRSRSEDVIEDYNLKDDQAVHVKIVMKDKKRKPIEFLLGKESHFFRKKGEPVVYAIDKDFYDVMGVYGDTDTPGSTRWLKKDILALKEDDVVRLTVTYPDKKIVLERVEKQGKGEGKEKKDTEKKEEKEKKKEYTWKIVSGAPAGLKPKDNPARRILDKLKELRCTDVVDPAKKEEWGLKDPRFVLEVEKKEKDKKETLTITGGLPDTGSSGYVMISGRPHVYELSNWIFKNLFPTAEYMFTDLPETGIKKDDIVRVTVTNFKKQRYTVARGKDNKLLLEPNRVSLEVKEEELKDILAGIEELEAEDFAAKDADPSVVGLAKPAAVVEIELKDGKKKTIRVGNKSRTMTGYYFAFDDGAVWAGAEYKVEKIFPELKRLYSHELLKVKPEDVKGVTIVSGTETLVLVRDKAGWKGTEAGKSFEADEKAVKDYLEYFNPFSIEDIVEKEAEGAPVTVTIALKDGGKKILKLRKGAKDSYTVTAEGLKGVFAIDKMTYERAAALFVKFRKEEPAEKKKEEKAKKVEKEKEEKKGETSGKEKMKKEGTEKSGKEEGKNTKK